MADTSVLLYDPVKKKHLLLLNEGPSAGKPWIVDLRICDNPLCHCYNIDFLCFPSEDSSDKQVLSTIQFALDAEKRRVYQPAGEAHDKTSATVAQAVASELGDAGWDYLRQYLVRVKQEQIEKCEVKRLDADFPTDTVNDPAVTVGYGEIFPFAPSFFFSIESHRWVAIDDYCVNPNCDCREVVLQFARTDGSGKIRDTIPAMYYNYKTAKFQEAKAPASHQPSLPALLSSMRAAWPAIETEVKERHRRLKILFKRALQRSNRQSTPPLKPATALPTFDAIPKLPVKAGRNDPCPCGSGRKYKKCCGR